ncbi:hypothetical protein [Sphingomonas sp.]|uniref:hypothetical protein n=1 Tax=Sphingomonas sp. TaxID=28214 RepID=UPI0031E2E54B
MHSTETFDRPGVATAEQGQVLLDGPDGVAVSMTPDAAEATAHSLVEAAAAARRQATMPAPSTPA